MSCSAELRNQKHEGSGEPGCEHSYHALLEILKTRLRPSFYADRLTLVSGAIKRED
jgi:hypothetical protein